MSASLRAVMKTTPDTPNAEAIALRRFQLITNVQELVTQGAPLSLALGTIAHQTLQDARGPVATRTLEDWFYAYKRGDFAALKPTARSDREQPRRISPAQQQQILDAVRARVMSRIGIRLDRSLRERNPDWGLRDLAEVSALAQRSGFSRPLLTEMPANNLSLVFRRSA